MVYGSGFENRRRETCRGFESLLLLYLIEHLDLIWTPHSLFTSI